MSGNDFPVLFVIRIDVFNHSFPQLRLFDCAVSEAATKWRGESTERHDNVTRECKINKSTTK
jgi:hypothetical protein